MAVISHAAQGLPRLVVLDNVQRLAIRPFGIADDGYTYFAAFTCTTRRILFNLLVNVSDERVLVINSNGERMFRCDGGLCEYYRQMEIRWSPTEYLGVIVNGNLINTCSNSQGQPQMLCQDLRNYGNLGNLAFQVVTREGQGQTSAIASVHSSCDEGTVSVTFHECNMSVIDKAIIMMNTLKLFYSIYNYQHAPMPRGLVALMPRGVHDKPTRRNLDCLDRLRIRPFCTDSCNKHILEIMHYDTKQVLMVAEFGEDRTCCVMRTHFRDTFGVLQFASTARHDKMEAFQVNNVKLGHWQRGHYYASANLLHSCDRLVMTDRKDLAFGNKRVLIEDELDKCNSPRIAEIDRDKMGDSISIKFQKETTTGNKALILANAVLYAMTFYNLFKAPVPSMAKYRYRPSCRALC